MALPTIILTAIVFVADTNSYLWTLAAGTLGGPILPLVGALVWFDVPPSKDSEDEIQVGKRAAALVYRVLMIFALLMHIILVYVISSVYGINLVVMFRAVWTDANASVAFMTVDCLILYSGICVYLAFRSGRAAIKAVALTPVLGPGAACCLVMAGMEAEDALSSVATSEKKKLP